MHTPPLPAGVQRFALADLTPEPWRNGGGYTRPVAATQVGARLRWRVSVADITQPGPFSLFDGIDRTAVLLQGPGLALQGPRERWVFEGVGAVARFPGELPLHATPGAEGSARLWNVMVERSVLRADVRVHRADAGTLAAARSALLVVIDGALGLRDGATPLLTLGPEEGLLLSDLAAPLSLHSLQGPAHWIVTTFLAR
jgi:environmental stress-induced protein Ves